MHAFDEDRFGYQRWLMVHEQIEQRGVSDSRVLQAMRDVPRHRFVSQELQDQAYTDRPLPIGFGQTISQPLMVAIMLALLDLRGGEKVLEVGTGSGYQAAVLACLASKVYSIELQVGLVEKAAQTLSELGYANVDCRIGDGSLGLEEAAPFDGIIVSAGAPLVPEPLKEQLADAGRLVIPVGAQGDQRLELWQRSGDEYSHRIITGVAFVPLRGVYGWGHAEWGG